MSNPSGEGSGSPAVSPQGEQSKGGGSLFRGVAKHSLIYGVGMIISRAVSFIMLPIYTRYLTPADYGVMALVEMTLDFISIIGGAQLALGVFRFYHKAEDEVSRHQVVSTSFLLVGCMYGILGLGVFLSAPLLSQLVFGSDVHTLVIRIAAGNLAASSLMIVPMSYARVRDLSVFYVGTNLAKLVLALAFNILFLIVLDMGVLGVFLSSLSANLLIGVFVSAWLVRGVGVQWSVKGLGDLVRYGVPLMATKVATFIATFSDRYFLQAAADEAVVGLYSLAYQFGFLLVMVGFAPMEMVWGPKRFEIAEDPNRDSILSRGFVLSNVLLFTTALGIILYVEEVLRIMSAPAFHPAAQVVPVILVAYVFHSWAKLQDIGVLVREKTGYITVANFTAAGVAVVGYALLIPRYYEWGAAAATTVAFFTRYVLTYHFSQRLWPVRYRWRPVGVLAGWATLVAVVALLLPPLHILAVLGIKTGLLVVYVVGLWLLPILDRDEREAVLRLGRDVWHRVGSR